MSCRPFVQEIGCPGLSSLLWLACNCGALSGPFDGCRVMIPASQRPEVPFPRTGTRERHGGPLNTNGRKPGGVVGRCANGVSVVSVRRSVARGSNRPRRPILICNLGTMIGATLASCTGRTFELGLELLLRGPHSVVLRIRRRYDEGEQPRRSTHARDDGTGV